VSSLLASIRCLLMSVSDPNISRLLPRQERLLMMSKALGRAGRKCLKLASIPLL
jgi:hypothetical protein